MTTTDSSIHSSSASNPFLFSLMARFTFRQRTKDGRKPSSVRSPPSPSVAASAAHAGKERPPSLTTSQLPWGQPATTRNPRQFVVLPSLDYSYPLRRQNSHSWGFKTSTTGLSASEEHPPPYKPRYEVQTEYVTWTNQAGFENSMPSQLGAL
jgi:hypothetical protein